MTRATIVNPDGCAVRRKEAVGAMTEDVETCREVQRHRDAGGELIQQVAQIALELLLLAEPEQLESGEEGVRDFHRVSRDRGGRRGCVKSDSEQSRSQPVVSE